ncbi:MAG: hypothetical protein AAF694_11655 [Bacteroidota bacterium]
MKDYLCVLAFFFLHTSYSLSQSLELMPGTERIFADVQWFKPLDEQYQWTVFSRTRLTVDYEENTDLFSGAYLNFTTKSGIGGTILGRISSFTAGADAGIHYYKGTSTLTLFALASINLSEELGYSWFSILRITPALSENWDFYGSLELFSSFNENGHSFSVQRIRGGLQRGQYQFGLAINVSEVGSDFFTEANPGVFVRREF